MAGGAFQNVDDVIDLCDVIGRSVDADDSGQDRREVDAAHGALGREDFGLFGFANLLQPASNKKFQF